MIATFEAASADAGARGTGALCRLFIREAIDLLVARRANRPAGVPFPPASRADHAVRRTGIGMMEPSNWRQALRSLRRRPAFLVASVLTLGFGAGMTTAVFSLVDTVLIKPLPYPDADRLVTVYEFSPAARERTSLVAPARLEDWKRLSRSFVVIVGQLFRERDRHQRRGAGASRRPRASRRGSSTCMRHRRSPGAPFTDEEERENGPGAAVISERFWTRRFHRDPTAVGRALMIGGRPYPDRRRHARDVHRRRRPTSGCRRSMAARLLRMPRRALPQRHRPPATGSQRRGCGARDLRPFRRRSDRSFRKRTPAGRSEVRPLKDVRDRHLAARARARLRRRRRRCGSSPSRTSPG